MIIYNKEHNYYSRTKKISRVFFMYGIEMYKNTLLTSFLKSHLGENLTQARGLHMESINRTIPQSAIF